jgi:histidyl-tRNA synthetase
LRFICDNVTKLGLSSAILDLDVTLARDWIITGAIFEVAPKVAMGSIGGGRYDDLTEFWFENMSGVGISLG